jgi:hypothetical protein
LNPSTLRSNPYEHPAKLQKADFNIDNLVRDPGLRPQICEYPVHQRDDVRRAYLSWGAYQKLLKKYEMLIGPFFRMQLLIMRPQILFVQMLYFI